MNLLSKLSSSTKAKTIEPREIFMTLPSKAPGYGYPRDVTKRSIGKSGLI